MNASCAVGPNEQTSVTQRIVVAILLGILIYVLYLLLSSFNLISSFTSAKITLPIAFAFGIVASVSTCMATAGALFLTTIGKIKEDRVVPAIAFNIGRVAAYAVFGFLLGLLGQMVSISYNGSVLLTVVVSGVMVLIGLDMLGIVSFLSIFPQNPLTKKLWKVEGVLAQKPKKTALFLGVFTYFLPCGFSQTVQLFALGTGNPTYSALIMTAFALGTVPTLMLLSFTSFFTKANWYPWFMKTVAVLIVMVGASYVLNTVQLYTNSVSAFDGYIKREGNVLIEDGYQIVKMDVVANGYEPNTFTIQKELPVKWIVNGIQVFGCQGFLNVPKLGIQKALARGENIFEFTPEEAGVIGFSCSTNAVQGSFVVM